MKIKEVLIANLFSLLVSGCVFVAPEGLKQSFMYINSDSIEAIVSGQPIPGSIRHIIGNKADINFRKNYCPCSRFRKIMISVSDVNKAELTGYQKFVEIPYDYLPKYNVEEKNLCEPFLVAENKIRDARAHSNNLNHFYLKSYELAWEAERALGPIECDPVRAKILADKAKEIALEEGAMALGFDVTGSYISELSGDAHPILAPLYSGKTKLLIRQNDKEITGTDSTGNAVLIGSRSKNPLKTRREIIRFKYSNPQISLMEVDGEWEVGTDGFSLVGTWNDSSSDASGKWKLVQIDQNIKAENRKKMEKLAQKYFSQQSSIEIKWENIDYIRVWTKDIIWGTCVFPFTCP